MIKKTAAVLLIERSPEYAEAVRRWLPLWRSIELRPGPDGDFPHALIAMTLRERLSISRTANRNAIRCAAEARKWIAAAMNRSCP